MRKLIVIVVTGAAVLSAGVAGAGTRAALPGKIVYSGTYKAAGGSTLNSVSASGSDVLGLLMNRSSARSLGVGLRIASAGPHSVKISWPTFAEGFRLESTSDMGTNWTRVNQVPTPGEDGLSLTLPTSTTQFYRLAGQ